MVEQLLLGFWSHHVVGIQPADFYKIVLILFKIITRWIKERRLFWARLWLVWCYNGDGSQVFHFFFHPDRNVTMPTALSTRRNVKVRKATRNNCSMRPLSHQNEVLYCQNCFIIAEDMRIIVMVLIIITKRRPLLMARWGSVHNYSSKKIEKVGNDIIQRHQAIKIDIWILAPLKWCKFKRLFSCPAV